MPPTLQTKIKSLQAIRGIAAVSVLLFHITPILREKFGYSFLGNFFMAGFSGVDVFFVLSGFIILHTSSRSSARFVSFIRKRFFRIYPIYWVVSVLTLMLFVFSPVAKYRFNFDLNFILGSLLLVPQKEYILGVAWTLMYEVIFYIVFALTYFFNPKLFYFTLTTWMILILGYYFYDVKTGVFSIDTMFKPIILEFMLGCVVAYFYGKGRLFNFSVQFLWIGLTLFFLSWLLFYHNQFAGYWVKGGDLSRVVFFGLPASLIIMGTLHSSYKVPNTFIYLGDASYSIYLVHASVISILIKCLTLLGWGHMFSGFLGAIILIASTLIISCLFYSLVERRLLDYFK